MSISCQKLTRFSRVRLKIGNFAGVKHFTNSTSVALFTHKLTPVAETWIMWLTDEDGYSVILYDLSIDEPDFKPFA